MLALLRQLNPDVARHGACDQGRARRGVDRSSLAILAILAVAQVMPDGARCRSPSTAHHYSLGFRSGSIDALTSVGAGAIGSSC